MRSGHLSLVIFFNTDVHSGCMQSHTHNHMHMHIQFTSRHCLGKQTVLCCLFMNSSVYCRQADDEDIYILLRYGHTFNIINLLSNLPSALLTHLVNLYSYLITCHKTACRSQLSSASFVTFEVLWRFFKALRRWGVRCCLVKNWVIIHNCVVELLKRVTWKCYTYTKIIGQEAEKLHAQAGLFFVYLYQCVWDVLLHPQKPSLFTLMGTWDQ